MSGTAGKSDDRSDDIGRELARLAATLGDAVRTWRHRRALSLRELAELTGIGRSTIGDVESGRIASLETYVRLGRALRLQREFALLDGRRQAGRSEDPVHAAMGEVLAARLHGLGFEVRLDEPYQHYQFAGRGDVVAWDAAGRFLHVENRTRFPNVQEAFGSFNAKRQYLAGALAERADVSRWRSETHVIVALWSAETLHAIRLHADSFRAVCGETTDAFGAWWSGHPPESGRHRALVVFDPIEGTRRDRRRWIGLADTIDSDTKPRYRDYADAREALRRAGLA